MVLKRILLWLSRVAIVASLLIPGGVLIGALLRLARGVFLRRTNEDTPAVTKLYLILSVVYLLSPIDLIPDVIPVIGCVPLSIVAAHACPQIFRRPCDCAVTGRGHCT